MDVKHGSRTLGTKGKVNNQPSWYLLSGFVEPAIAKKTWLCLTCFVVPTLLKETESEENVTPNKLWCLKTGNRFLNAWVASVYKVKVCSKHQQITHIPTVCTRPHTSTQHLKKNHSHFQLVKNPSNSITSFKSWILSIGFVCLIQLSFRICCLVLKYIKDRSQARTKTDFIWASSGDQGRCTGKKARHRLGRKITQENFHFRPSHTLGQNLVHPKDQTPKHKLKCSVLYTGETKSQTATPQMHGTT